MAVPWRLAVSLALFLPLLGCQGRRSAAIDGAFVEARVLDLEGRPLPGVELELAKRRSRSGADGAFRLPSPQQPAWLQARLAGYLPVLRPVLPGQSLLLRLGRDDGKTLVIRAAGDVMAGRRFYTPEAGSPQPPLLAHPDFGHGHRRLLESISPLLRQADLTLVNLESPLLADPVAERRGLRSQRFHPSKDFVFASAPGLAGALRQAGVDVLGLANNHIYDAFEPGLHSTLAILQQAGFRPGVGYFGAGDTPDQAWRPAVQRVRGMTISTLGCNTIHGAQHPWSYVASVEQAKGGAALCEPARLAAAISAARRRGPVIVMVHGGNEYQAEPTTPVAEMVQIARLSGASLILNHHPHVIGGLRWDGRSLVADSLGNLLFDQTLWPTFPSLLLEVQMSQGRISRVIGYPLLLQGYRPHLALGELADWILADVAYRQPGPWLIESGLLVADLSGRAVEHRRWQQLPALPRAQAPAAPLWKLPSGLRFCGERGMSGLEFGRDLIGVGRFEQELLGNDAAAGPAGLWRLAHSDQQVRPEAAHRGRFGVRLQRHASHRQPVLLQPLHRLPVRPGQRLSFLGWIRGSAGARPRLQLSWYSSRRGPSQARLVQPLLLNRPQHWQPLRLDVVVPEHAVAVGAAIALDPPRWGKTHLDLDDLELVHWQAPGLGKGGGWLRAQAGGSVCLSDTTLPGAPRATAAKALLQAWPGDGAGVSLAPQRSASKPPIR